jgi:hypothetical protein
MVGTTTLVVAMGASPAGAIPAIPTCFYNTYVSVSSGAQLETDLNDLCTTIYVPSGTYTYPTNFTIGGDRSVTVIGAAKNTTILKAGPGTVFNYSGGATVTLSRLTITGGSNTVNNSAGGVANTGTGSLILSDVKVTGNSDSAGGGLSAAGVYNGHNDGPNSASMTITDGSSVDSNLATGEYCTGGILNNGGTLTIENSSVRWNTCTGLEGTGGIGNGNGGTLNISQSSIEINRATDEGYGGGIWNDSTLVITDGVTVSGNYAECYGGGLMDALPPSYVVQAHITGGTFIDNQSEYGGGIFLQAGPIYLTSSIVTVNSSDSQGGAGIYENAGDGTSLTSTSSWVLLNIPDNIFTGGIAYPNPAECNP